MPDAAALRALREGVPLGDGGPPSRPARVRALGTSRDGQSWLEIVLTEGRNRQVRRMCAAVGHEVRELVRVAIGGLALGDLAPGRWRRLDADEVRRLEDACEGRSGGRAGGRGYAVAAGACPATARSWSLYWSW